MTFLFQITLPFSDICFDKGKTLRIPETVPFRLTQNIYNGMGLTGIEGDFRIACETVFSNLRANKDILLSLLESFEYHPLLDWNTSLNLSLQKEEIDSNSLVFEDNSDTSGKLETVTAKNQQASVVLNAIRQRLNEPIAIPSLIQQAISVDNLSQMYEGWFPWI